MPEFNAERPARGARHEMPGRALYRLTTARPYQGLPELEYPLHDRGTLVTACGRICMAPRGPCGLCRRARDRPFAIWAWPSAAARGTVST
jgi:hypothetical protein